jgi:hypothetical protein
VKRNFKCQWGHWTFLLVGESVATPLWEKCEDETHTLETGTWESTGTPETSEFDCRGQKTSHWDVLYIIGKVSKCRCQKWARMSHLDICNISYGKKKGHQKSRIDPTPRRAGGVRHAVGKFSTRTTSLLETSSQSEVGPKRFWPRKVAKVQIGTVSGLPLGSPRIKNHSDVGAVERRREYYMGEGGGFPQVWAVVSLVSLGSPVACPSTKGVPKSELTNLLVGLMQIRVNN